MPLRFSTLYRKTKYPSRDFSHTGLGGGIFARLLSAPKARLGWERLRSFAPSREAKQNIFQFLLEEKGSCAKIEKRGKCFALHRRQAGGAAGRGSSVQSRFALCSVIATKLDIESFRKKARACFARALWGFYSDFPPQSAIRPTNPNRLFCPAGGGSELRSNSSRKCGISNFFLCRIAALRSQFFNPALYGQRRLTI